MKFFYLILFYFFSTIMYSQADEKQTMVLTAKIGYSHFYYEVSGHPSRTLNSINFGLLGDYYLNRTWSIQTGLLYQKMGGKTSIVKFEVEYINVPINMNWHFGKTKGWNLNFGIIQSFRANNSMAQDILGADIKKEQTSLNLGLGYRIRLNNTIGILLDYQFLAGITNVDQDEIYSLYNKGGNFNIGIVMEF